MVACRGRQRSATVALRDELVELAPEAGEDADAEYPGQREPFDPAEADRWREWSWTLANFDAIAADREEKILEEKEGDRSRSRALGEILNAKVYNLQYPDDPNRKVRADLDDLRTRLNHLRDPAEGGAASGRGGVRVDRPNRPAEP